MTTGRHTAAGSSRTCQKASNRQGAAAFARRSMRSGHVAGRDGHTARRRSIAHDRWLRLKLLLFGGAKPGWQYRPTCSGGWSQAAVVHRLGRAGSRPLCPIGPGLLWHGGARRSRDGSTPYARRWSRSSHGSPRLRRTSSRRSSTLCSSRTRSRRSTRQRGAARRRGQAQGRQRCRRGEAGGGGGAHSEDEAEDGRRLRRRRPRGARARPSEYINQGLAKPRCTILSMTCCRRVASGTYRVCCRVGED